VLDREHAFVCNRHMPRRPIDGQHSLSELGAPLVDTTFVVVDVETTGGSPATDSLTEIGAVRIRGGECLGTFSTLVNPGRAIPPTITVLTGITESMVARAPRVEEVLPSLLEFIGDAVVVGHNVRFDLGFLEAALARSGREPLRPVSVDTVALARRLLRDEVPNCKLGTLAERLRLPHQPAHRALDDALATADLLHVLLERAGSLGVRGLDDLLALPGMAGHPLAGKLALTERLPRSPGVYLFRAQDGRVLYVGKATNLRARVRSYFSTDERRKVSSLLRATARIDHKVCESTLEAEVLETRLIRDLLPHYNQHGTRWQRYPYLKLTLDEAFPRLSVVRAPRDDGALYLGPLRSQSQARSIAEAIETVVPLRRCAQPVRAGVVRDAPCTSAQLGVSACPCTGSVDAAEYAKSVQTVVRGLTDRPELLVEPLTARMEALAADERFEEAALTRERLANLSTALRRQRRTAALVQCERIVVGLDGGGAAELRHGVLWRMWPAEPGEGEATPLWAARSDEAGRDVEMRPESLPVPDVPLPREFADELTCVASWLHRHADRIRLESADGELSSPLPRLDEFQPAGEAVSRRTPRRVRRGSPQPTR
jgi:DNA polymerase-3 subunit epsilon